MQSKHESGFIDVHVHPPTKEFLIDAGGEHVQAAAKKFGQTIELKTFDQMLNEYSVAGVEKLVLFAWDAETTSKRPRVTNEFVAKMVDQYPDRLIGFASVDPHKKTAVRELRRRFQT
jgi:predicted TIM-barrel fold metal-dependent hydrolase